MKKINKIIFINSNDYSQKLSDNNIYIFFTRSQYYFYKNIYSNVDYFFDYKLNFNEKDEVDYLEQSINHEISQEKSYKYIFLCYFFLYKDMIQYLSIKERLFSIIKKYNINNIEISRNCPIFFKKSFNEISNKSEVNIIYSDSVFGKFNYRDGQYYNVDIPFPNNIEKSNFFIYLASKYYNYMGISSLRFTNFIVPKDSAIFKLSIFTFLHRLKTKLLLENKVEPYLDFSIECASSINLISSYWDKYDKTLLSIFKNSIKRFKQVYDDNSLNILENKILYLLKKSKVNTIFIDSINSPFRRLISYVGKKIDIKVYHLPHGIYTENEYPYIDHAEYMPDQILTWSEESSKHLNDKGWNTRNISLGMSTNHNDDCQQTSPKILAMVSHGNRIDLNSFEKDIVEIARIADKDKLDVTFKYHSLIGEYSKINSVANMGDHIKLFEKNHKIAINIYDDKDYVTDIMRNYSHIIFTTWTTGIIEAINLEIPFVIITNKSVINDNVSNQPIRIFDSMDMPIFDDYKNGIDFLLKNKNIQYLRKAKENLNRGQYL